MGLRYQSFRKKAQSTALKSLDFSFIAQRKYRLGDVAILSDALERSKARTHAQMGGRLYSIM